MNLIKIIGKFRVVLSTHQRLRIVELFFLMLIGGILETFSVSLILPFMTAIMQPEEFMNKWYVEAICKTFEIDSFKSLIFIVAAMLAFLYVIKNAYLVAEYNIQYRFVYSNMFMLQKRLLQSYMKKPYEYFLDVGSGEIIRVINGDVVMTFELLTMILTMFTELVVAVMLITSIAIIAPFITLCMAVVLLLLLLFIYFILRPLLHKAGVNSQKFGAEMNKWMLQMIQGIKEVKVMNREDFFQSNFESSGAIYTKSIRWSKTFSILPRFIIEGISMGAIFVVIAIMIGRGADIGSFVPIISAVALAAVRLLPSINRISISTTQIAYSEPMLDKVIEVLQTLIKQNENSCSTWLGENDNEVKFNEKICINGVTYQYPNTEAPVLKNIELTIHKGETIGIIGQSGAGKTTTVDILLGLLNPQDGAILVDGAEIGDNIRAWHELIGYIPQMIFMLDGSIRDNVAFGTEKVSDEDIWNALRGASLESFVKSLPNGLDTEIGERGIRVSGGQRQRIGIARALYRNPAILIFDEATSALDNDTEDEIMDAINNLHGTKTMIIIAHRISTIQVCDHVYRVENKSIKLER